jgi:hypothetical protein
MQREPREKRIFAFKATRLVWLIFGILEAMIALRFLFNLIAANPNSPIAGVIYAITDFFLFPFGGLTVTTATGDKILEVPSFITLMIIYAWIAWAIERTIWVIFYLPRGPVVQVAQTMSSENHTHQQ